MNSNTVIGSIITAFILSVASSAHAQQVVVASAQPNESKISKPDDNAKTSFAKNRNAGKTRGEVLAELEQAQASGTAMPTGFLAFDDAAHDAKYKTSTQHTVAD